MTGSAEQRIVAVVDIGSATVHLLVAALRDDGRLLTIDEASAISALAARRSSGGEIPAGAEADVAAALRRYQRLVRAAGAEQLLVVATEAVRAAPNGRALVQRLSAVLDLPIVVLTPAQETALAVLGAYGGALPERGLFADSGGASTQVAAIAAGVVAWQRSLAIGAASLTASHLVADPPTGEQIARARAAIRAALADLPAPPGAADVTPVATGGSARTLLGLPIHSAPAGCLTAAFLTEAGTLLSALPSGELARRFGLAVERARILPAGALILTELLHWSGYDPWRVSAAGLREGVVRAWYRQPEHWLAGLEKRAGPGPGDRYTA